VAADGCEAIELYRQHASGIVLVLLDVRMPVLGGPATLAILRRINPALMYCFMSGNAADLLETKFDRVIAKPFHLSELKQLVVRLTQNSV
jgi:CheY-like chemotaxis protein